MEVRRMLPRANTAMSPPSALPNGAPFDPERTRPGNDLAYMSPPTSLDTKIIIATASLLAVLLCSLCMHFTIRWALGRSVRQHADEPAAAATKPHTGMTKLHVDSLPTRLYGDNAEVPAQPLHASSSQCVICFADFADGERIRVLPNCQHGFHVGCIDTWLSQSSSCPTCRGNLMDVVMAAEDQLSGQVRVHIVIIPRGDQPNPTLTTLAASCV